LKARRQLLQALQAKDADAKTRAFIQRKLDAQPALEIEEEPVLAAFYELRQAAGGPMGPEPISYQEAGAYLDARGFEEPEVRGFWTRLLLELDREFFRWARERRGPGQGRKEEEEDEP
jgi:hypothetical protein